MKKIIYIAHPVGGDVPGNMIKIGKIYRQLSLQNEVVPFVPYVAAIGSLNDSVPEERLLGFSHNKAIFHSGCIDEVWLYGDRISPGMLIEIHWANELGIKVVDKTYKKTG